MNCQRTSSLGEKMRSVSEQQGEFDAAERPHRLKVVRTARWRAAHVRAKREGRGWGLVAESPGVMRTTLIMRRPKASLRRRVRVATAVTLGTVLVLVGGGLAVVKLSPSTDHVTIGRIPAAMFDGDGDGIPDQDESFGWWTRAGVNHQTDPNSADRDNDGLTDGEEAGPATDLANGNTVFAGRSDPNNVDSDDDGLVDAAEVDNSGEGASVSDPLQADSDGDGVGDGDEFVLDMDPSLPDTDDDGLSDQEELDFGSDPTLVNADDDSYDDAEELENQTSPLSYDLTGGEKLEAGRAGLIYGDCDQCALDAGLRMEQVESVEYLAGHFASGAAVYGDIRDVALDLWKKKFLAAGISLLALLPLVGDGSKAVALLTKFGKRGDRAAQAVRDVTEKLSLPAAIKKKVLDALPSRLGKLPTELAGGPTEHVVYTGFNLQTGRYYVGITSHFDRRAAQHATAGRGFTPEPMAGVNGLSLGEARAIEQVCIVQGGLAKNGGGLENRINSVSPTDPSYGDYLATGEALLKKSGATCPVKAAR